MITDPDGPHFPLVITIVHMDPFQPHIQHSLWVCCLIHLESRCQDVDSIKSLMFVPSVIPFTADESIHGLSFGALQITNIRIVKEAMQEAAYMLAELALMCAPMAYLDVGGGLAIDYDGSKTDTANSLSYTMQQYANDVVATVQVRTLDCFPLFNHFGFEFYSVS